MSRSSTSSISREEARRKGEEEMRQAFKVFDKDGNGLIDSKELRETMKALGEKLSKADVKAMIKAADENGDGKIDYEGLISYIQISNHYEIELQQSRCLRHMMSLSTCDSLSRTLSMF